MKKTALLVLVLLGLGLFGCKGKSPKPAGGAGGPTTTGGATVTPGKPAKTFLIGFSQCTFEDPWRINMNREMEAAAAAHPEVKLIIANGENSNSKQIADVENFIVKGVDALIISPREAAPLTDVVAKAFDRGIPVIVLDRRVLGEKYTAFIGASNVDIGRAAGEYLVQRLPAGGKVVEIEGITGATATSERRQGFREIIARYPALEVIYDQPADYKRSPAKTVMDNALQAYPRIDAVYAHNDEMAIGAFLAAKAVGRDQTIIFIGIDGQAEAVKMIRDGLIAATFVYPNGAKEAIETALQVLRGETVPRDIKLQTTRITKDESPEYLGFQ